MTMYIIHTSTKMDRDNKMGAIGHQYEIAAESIGEAFQSATKRVRDFYLNETGLGGTHITVSEGERRVRSYLSEYAQY